MVILLLPLTKAFAQEPLKQLKFKNKNDTIYCIRFDKTVTEKFLNDYAKKNGYKLGDTSSLDCLKQKKLPIHCQVWVFNPTSGWCLETNGSSYGYRKKIGPWMESIVPKFLVPFENKHLEEEGEVEHYFCFKK